MKTAAALLALLAHALVRAAEPCTLQALEIPVELREQRAVATVTLNGEPAALMVDTGSYSNVLTAAMAERLKLRVRYLPREMRVLGLTGEADARQAFVKEMKLVGGTLPDLNFLVTGHDFDAGTSGILGRSILFLADTEFDLAHGAIRLAFPRGDCSATRMAYWSDAAQPPSELPLLPERPHSKAYPIQARVWLNGQPLMALFDSGAGHSLVSLAAARRLGVDIAALPSAEQVGGIDGGFVDSVLHRFDSLVIGDETRTAPLLRVADVRLRDIDMLIGMDFFLAHRIYVQRSPRRMYFTPAAAAGQTMRGSLPVIEGNPR